MRQYRWKPFEKYKAVLINSCANTHNNFNSTDKSGINTTIDCFTEDIRMIYFQSRKFPMNWQVYRNRFVKGCQSWTILKFRQFPAIGSETILSCKDDYYFILTSINFSMFWIFANLFSRRGFELLLREASYCIFSSIKQLWSLSLSFSRVETQL